MTTINNTTYQLPPKEIANLVDITPTPAISISPDGQWMMLLERPNLPSIEVLAQPELKLAGIRINPRTNGESRTAYYTNLKRRNIDGTNEQTIKGLPEQVKIQYISWSPNSAHLAFTVTETNGISLWVVNVQTLQAKQLTTAVLNNVFSGHPFTWMPDGQSLIYRSILENRGHIPEASLIPTGPKVQESLGKTAAARTYQDLLKNEYDAQLFEYYATSQMMQTDLQGNQQTVGTAAIIDSFSPSPNGQYILLQTICRPFSYLVPYFRFPMEIILWDKVKGQTINITKLPLAEDVPVAFGSVRTGPRYFTWRADAPATLYWVEAQDGGDAGKEAEIRDQMFFMEAPFMGKKQASVSTKLRYGGVVWGNGELAVLYQWWWKNRQEITSFFQPDQPSLPTKTVFEQSWEDRYHLPGNFVTEPNKAGKRILKISKNKKSLYLIGEGASPEGNRPFVDELDIFTQEKKRWWRSQSPYYERPMKIMDEQQGIILTYRQSQEERANYFLRHLNNDTLQQITHFPHPYPQLKNTQKQLLKYQRKDGVKLTATLYLPPNYDKEKDGRLPVLVWAYPREFKSAAAAGQVKESPHQFLMLWSGSPLYWLMKGYAVLQNPSMPIIGEGDTEPNDTYIKQLADDAEAAINHLVDDLGIADRKRFVIGGHSYGAFMTANLLAHTDLFAAGIARSGAYNRTLTPFGFQAEERTLWEVPDIYIDMSPFMYAHKIKSPLLLIHGDADNNPGTYPMQSERFYYALKGHGATVRLVMLPHESHGYRARESVMHVLWEIDQWLTKYV